MVHSKSLAVARRASTHHLWSTDVVKAAKLKLSVVVKNVLPSRAVRLAVFAGIQLDPRVKASAACIVAVSLTALHLKSRRQRTAALYANETAGGPKLLDEK